MKFRTSKTTATLIALFLIVSTGASSILIPQTAAHTPVWQIPTFAYINVGPNPIGVGQQAFVLIWLDKTFGSDPGLTNNYRFHNYNLTIIKPDGLLDVKIFDVCTDTTSSQGYAYTPDQVGNYTFIFTFPGQKYDQYLGAYNPASAYVNDTYLPSSAKTVLTVQQEPIPNAVDSFPLPSEYWTRPIYAENPYWWTISSNWLGLGSPISANIGSGTISGNAVTNFQRYPGDAVGPQTSHIMWTRSFQMGGVVGGNNSIVSGDTWFDGTAYVQRLTNPIIVNGKIYYTEPLNMPSEASLGGGTYGPTKCVDIRTGQVIWSRMDVPALSFAYVYAIHDPQQHGTYPAVLFTANFGRAFDADTGEPLFNVTGVPTGTILMGPQGEHIRLVIANAGNTTNPDWRLAEWNSSKLWTGLGFAIGTSGWVPNISGTVDATTKARYDWNISIPWRNTMTATPTAIVALRDDLMVLRNGSLPAIGGGTPYTYFAISLKPESLGNLLWMKTYNPPEGNITINQGPADAVNRVFVEAYKETMQFVGYSIDTGEKLWGPTPSQNPLDYYGNGGTANIGAQAAYGKLYSIGYSGVLFCYDSKTGEKLWTYGNGGLGNSTNAGLQTGQGTYPGIIAAVGNEVVYLITTEHTIQTPLYKGAMTRAINATNGAEIWALSSYPTTFITLSFAIADGFALFPNSYDNRLYSIGRGPSATTLQAPLTAVTAGEDVVIQGTVTDVSAGTKQDEQAARFTNGVPVSSDASMSDWMGYIYQQKPLPVSFTGVKVSIDAIDPNGNYIHLGDATTNANSLFYYIWTPPNIPGAYTIYATFAGTNGYWPSNAVTAMTIQGEHPTATPAPTQAPSMSDLYFVPATAGLFVLVIVVAIVLALLMLRKRP
jgi:hypothetical protein